ncbi:hypothetical protein [Cryobacterium sp. Y11]|uniref:hypothetical protein n=1 Tax=Cryobacterium sp. Y11 TaxID=2045016 RepID=UPI0011B0583E|nr:hypothetical protein [Cryobacterium sp. Y11]
MNSAEAMAVLEGLRAEKRSRKLAGGMYSGSFAHHKQAERAMFDAQAAYMRAKATESRLVAAGG